MSIQRAFALTSSVMMLGAISAVRNAVLEANPLQKDLPIIDYQTVLVVSPVLMLGSSAGALVNNFIMCTGVAYLLSIISRLLN